MFGGCRERSGSPSLVTDVSRQVMAASPAFLMVDHNNYLLFVLAVHSLFGRSNLLNS